MRTVLLTFLWQFIFLTLNYCLWGHDFAYDWGRQIAHRLECKTVECIVEKWRVFK